VIFLIKRVFLIVLDSFGIGHQPDSGEYGDYGANTLKTVSGSGKFKLKNMRELGLFNIDGTHMVKGTDNPIGAHGRCMEISKGKDTTTGHWEIAGVISEKPFPVYPEGFPAEIIDKISEETGRGIICNKTYSGTEVIKDYGEEHLKTGDLIVYTSADSVFQIAAHEDIIGRDTLYEYCKIAREILKGEYGVGRVIARPFAGEPGEFYRTDGRHDFSLEPPETVLDILKKKGYDVIGVGKIHDIFAGKGISEYVYTKDNYEGIERTLEYMKKNFHGLCFVNLVDFDMKYGHRNDIDGYAEALSYFDEKITDIKNMMNDDDVLMITADHGCDPGFKGTDHTREYVPLLVYGKNIKPINLGTIKGFNYVGELVKNLLENEDDLLIKESR